MFNIVLVYPEIPQNTGNIGRTCVATGTSLHLIEPLGFRLDEKQIKRGDYFYLPFVAEGKFSITTDSKAEIIECLPSKQ